MPRLKYEDHNFKPASLRLIAIANEIITEYQAQGFDLTLRQLYYQLVARDHIPNTVRSYKRLGYMINNARLAGLVDWNHIIDRTRSVRSAAHFGKPKDIIERYTQAYRIDMWANQGYRPEVWIEKDALIGVISGVCNDYDVPYFSCRGYSSQSAMWRSSQKFMNANMDGKVPVVIHLGDHDPSGLDMTRDIFDRLELFMGGMEVMRIALNMDQIEQHSPPPNPAKISDSRYYKYAWEHGTSSWELDALDPRTIADTISRTLDGLIERSAWEADEAREKQGQEQLKAIAENFETALRAAQE